MRELIEQGFEVLVVTDGTAAAQLPGWDGYAAALTNFRMVANHVAPTAETLGAIQAAYRKQGARRGSARPRVTETTE